MKFKEYLIEGRVELTEEEVTEAIKSKCKMALDAMRKSKHIFKRYDKSKDVRFPSFFKSTTRSVRKPLDTQMRYHNMMNKWFLENFGWRARSQNVLFTQGSKVIGSFHPLASLAVFPVGKFKFIWSPKIYDVTIDYGLDYHDDMPEEELIVRLERSEYTDKNIIKALQSHKEIMIQCKEYYSIRIKDNQDIIKDLMVG